MRDARKLEHKLIARTRVAVIIHGTIKERLSMCHLQLKVAVDAVHAHICYNRIQGSKGKLASLKVWGNGIRFRHRRPSHLNLKQVV